MTKTTCDWTVERLPWWANGTLEEGEAERVAAHLAECAACRDELAATRQAMALYAAHLPIEALLDLVDGGEGAEEDGAISRAAVEAHLGHCAACREELSLLRESRAAVAADPADRVGTVTAFAPRRAAAPGAVPRRWFDRRAVALAASILVAVVSTGGWLLTGRVADERGDRLAKVERLLTEARTREPAAGDPAMGSSAEALAAAAERAVAEREAAERRIAQLEADNADLLAAARSDDPGQIGGVAATYSWDLVRTRGAGPDDGAPAFAPPPGDDLVVIHFAFDGDRQLALVIENATGQRLAVLPVQRAAGAGDLGPSVALRLDRLPAGPLRLRLLAGDEEIGRGTLVNER